MHTLRICLVVSILLCVASYAGAQEPTIRVSATAPSVASGTTCVQAGIVRIDFNEGVSFGSQDVVYLDLELGAVLCENISYSLGNYGFYGDSGSSRIRMEFSNKNGIYGPGSFISPPLPLNLSEFGGLAVKLYVDAQGRFPVEPQAVEVAKISPATDMSVLINQIDTSDCPTMNAVVTVYNEEGAPITDLDQCNFFVLQDNQCQGCCEVVEADDSGFPISVGLCLDYSGSMERAVTDLETAAVAFINSLGGLDSAEIIKFSSTYEVVQGFTSYKTALKDAVLNGLIPDGRTSFYDAVYKAVEDTMKQSGRRAVIAMTDGVDNMSEKTVQDVTALAQFGDVPIYIIGLMGEFGLDVNVLKHMATSTGGEYFQTVNSTDLVNIYNTISLTFSSQYIISCTTTEIDGKDHSLKVHVYKDGQTATDVKTFTACDETSDALPQLTLGSASGGPQDVILLDLSLANEDEIPMSALSADIIYDNAEVELVTIDEGPAVESADKTLNIAYINEKTVRIVVLSSANNSLLETGVLAGLKFRIKNSTAPGTYEIGLKATASGPNGRAVDMLKGNGVITVSETRCSMLGDCDCDGQVTIQEVQKAINMHLGVDKVKNCVDLNGDWTVSLDEVQQVLNNHGISAVQD